MPPVPSISVVIPVYNAEATLPGLIRRLDALLPGLSGAHEIILVNDGSADRSWQIISDLAQSNAAVRGISLMRNFGQHNATLAGIRAARHDIIVTMDDDGQHPPEEIVNLLATLQPDCDVVYGYAIRPQHERWRNPLTGAAKWLLEKGGLFPDARRISAFRVFRAEIRDAFAACHAPCPVIDVLLRWGTARIGFVAVRHAPRQGGRSASTALSLLRLTMHMVTAYSLRPVQWIECFGIAIGVVGLLLLAGHLLMGAIVIAMGVAILGIGIAGEYAARTYHLALGKPQFIIRTTTDQP